MINTVISLPASLLFHMFTLRSRENPRQDPFAEEDFEGHAQLTAIVGDKAVQMSIFHQSLGVLPSGKLT
jgi:enolase